MPKLSAAQIGGCVRKLARAYIEMKSITITKHLLILRMKADVQCLLCCRRCCLETLHVKSWHANVLHVTNDSKHRHWLVAGTLRERETRLSVQARPGTLSHLALLPLPQQHSAILQFDAPLPDTPFFASLPNTHPTVRHASGAASVKVRTNESVLEARLEQAALLKKVCSSEQQHMCIV